MDDKNYLMCAAALAGGAIVSFSLWSAYLFNGKVNKLQNKLTKQVEKEDKQLDELIELEENLNKVSGECLQIVEVLKSKKPVELNAQEKKSHSYLPQKVAEVIEHFANKTADVRTHYFPRFSFFSSIKEKETNHDDALSTFEDNFEVLGSVIQLINHEQEVSAPHPRTSLTKN